MRTTIDLPDALFRRTKAAAALRGVSMKEVLVRALEQELSDPNTKRSTRPPRRVALPLVRLGKGRVLDLDNFNFDDLLA